MQHIKCGQREQSLGQKALWDHDCTFYPFFYPFWDQCQEVTAGKSAEQRRRRGRGREGANSEPWAHQCLYPEAFCSSRASSLFCSSPFFSFHSLYLSNTAFLFPLTPQPLCSLSSFSIYNFPSPLSWLVYLIFLFLIAKWLFPKLMLIYIHTSIYKNVPVSLYSHKN